MGLAAVKEPDRYTYADYLKWDDGERWELIDGEAYSMTPSPAQVHQDISQEIFVQLWLQLKGKPCKIYHAPYDVILPLRDEAEDQIFNVVQPDLFITCDTKKLQKRGCVGAPDMIIEILSPSTSRKDRTEKFSLYQAVGVKEYWMISPEDKIVEVYVLGDDGRYGSQARFVESDSITLATLPELTVDLRPVFPEDDTISRIPPKGPRHFR